MHPPPDCWSPPPDSLRLGPQDVHVWLLRLGSPPRQAWLALGDEERRRAGRLRGVRRERYVSAQFQLRQVLSQYLGATAQSLRFVRAPRGKPALAQPWGDLRFNLSHSNDRALVAVASGREVGVDLELCRGIDAVGLARRFFSAPEAAALADLSEAERQARFFRLWTAKEALGKAAGMGIRGVLRRVEFDPDARAWRTGHPQLDARHWTLIDLPPLSRYATGLAVGAGPVELCCWLRGPD